MTKRVPVWTIAGLLLAAPALAADMNGVDLSAIDRSVKPGDNFYLYANGAWLKRARIPADQARWGAFNVLNQKTQLRTRGLLEKAEKTARPGTDARQAADFYESFMNEKAIAARGTAPLKAGLAAIGAVRNKTQLARLMGEGLRADVDPLNNTNFHTENLFGIWVAPGFSDSAHYTPYLLQGGLGMPTRDFYLGTSAKMKANQAAYRKYVATALGLTGIAGADQKADAVYDLEVRIAKAHESIVESQDVVKANNPWLRADFVKKAPGLDWDQYFAGAGLSGIKRFIVWQPAAFAGLSKLVAQVPLETWKVWLSFHLINHFAPVLPKAFGDAQFAFYGKALSGTQQQPRWKRAINATNHVLGDAVGKLYAARYFPPEAKAKAQVMVKNIIAALGPADRRADLDDASDQGQGQGEIIRALCRHRLSGKMV